MTRSVGALRVSLVALALGVAFGIDPAARADCAGPTFDIRQRTLRVGEDLTIQGQGWGDACNDTDDPGCGTQPPLGDPIQDIDIVLREKGTDSTHEIATVDADTEYSFETTVVVPDVPPGRYVISDTREKGDFSGPPLRIRPER